MNKPKPLSDTEIRNVVKTAIEEAVEYVESSISPQRERAMRYYEGKCDIGHERGRSKIVSTKIRDTIRQIKPSLMRVFLQSDKPVEFKGTNSQQAQAAENASEYCQIVFNKQGGYKLLQDVFHDSLIAKNGIAKIYFDPDEKQEIVEYANLTDEELAMIASNPEFEVLEHVTQQAQMGEMVVSSHDLKVVKTIQTGEIKLESIPPEQFFVDASASCIEDAYITGQRTEKSIGDLIEMGFKWEELEGLDSLDGQADNEDYERKHYDDDRDGVDPSTRPVMVTECYMKVDVEGTGIPQPYKFLMGGSKYRMLSHEPWDDVPFVSFCADPIPHAFFGQSIADVLFAEQDSSTVILRGILDNTALVNNPRLEILDGATNVEDVLNNEIGGIVRSKQMGSIQPLVIPFVAGQTLEALNYLDRNADKKTGVNAASNGLSPDALGGNQTATAANAMVSANNATMELMSRNLAEGGVTQMFKRILKLVIENASDDMMMKVSGDQYTPIDVANWDVDMDVQVNVGLGTGNEMQKMQALAQAMQAQEKIVGQFGLGNGIVGPKEIINTMTDLLRMSGIQNSDRYFQPIDDQKEAQLMQAAQQAQQAQQGQGDPTQGLVEAEKIKAQTQLQVKSAELQQRQQGDMAKLQAQFAQDNMDRDLERDKLDANIAIEQAKLANKNALDEAALYAKINAPRQVTGQ
jgi:hypothetical protein